MHRIMRLRQRSFVCSFTVLFMSLLRILILVLSPLFASAQAPSLDNPGTPEQRARTMTDSMQLHLRLRADQLAPVRALNLKYAHIMEKEVVQSKRNTFMKYWKGLEINENKEKELRPLLDQEQWKLYERYKSGVMKKIWARL